MLKSIPWDVWAAAAAAVIVALIAILDTWPALLTVAYVALCAYVVVETINGEHSG
jgi:hypothetical protein